MTIYQIDLDVWVIGIVVFSLFLCAFLFVAFRCRSFLKTGALVLLSVLKIKAGPYDGDTKKDKAFTLVLWSVLVAFFSVAIVLLARMDIQQISSTVRLKNADTWVSGEVLALEHQANYYRGNYQGQDVQLEVDGVNLSVWSMDDDDLQKLIDAARVSVLYAEADGINMVVKISADEQPPTIQ